MHANQTDVQKILGGLSSTSSPYSRGREEEVDGPVHVTLRLGRFLIDVVKLDGQPVTGDRPRAVATVLKGAATSLERVAASR